VSAARSASLDGGGALRPYAAVVGARFRMLLQYRAAAIAGLFTQIVFGLVLIMVYEGFYRSSPPEVQPIGDPRPSDSFTFEFPLTVWDSAASPTRESRKMKPYALDVVATPRHPIAGEPVELELRVRMATSLELREVTDFDVLHERLMHVFVVSQDLSDFAHEHPEPAGPGLFRLTHRFARPGRYRLFADVAPRDAGAQALDATLVVGPAAGTGAAAPVPAPAPTPAPKTRVAWTLPESGMIAGRTLVVNANLTDEKGRPVRDLEPWLGAIGHLLLVTRDGETFAHSHPDDREPGVGKDGRIPFLVRLPRAGPYKGWLQFQRRGKVETLEVTLDATPYSAPR